MGLDGFFNTQSESDFIIDLIDASFKASKRSHFGYKIPQSSKLGEAWFSGDSYKNTFTMVEDAYPTTIAAA